MKCNSFQIHTRKGKKKHTDSCNNSLPQSQKTISGTFEWHFSSELVKEFHPKSSPPEHRIHVILSVVDTQWNETSFIIQKTPRLGLYNMPKRMLSSSSIPPTQKKLSTANNRHTFLKAKAIISKKPWPFLQKWIRKFTLSHTRQWRTQTAILLLIPEKSAMFLKTQ